MSGYISSDWIQLVLRSILGTVMIYYGWPKIRNLKSNAQDFEDMGFRPGNFWGTWIAVLEFFGGIAVVVGLYAELGAALFGFQMMVGTFWKLKIRKPFTDYSYDLQLFALCLAVMLWGAGLYSLRTYPGTIFLRWHVAIASLVGAFAFAALSRPRRTATSERPAAAA